MYKTTQYTHSLSLSHTHIHTNITANCIRAFGFLRHVLLRVCFSSAHNVSIKFVSTSSDTARVKLTSRREHLSCFTKSSNVKLDKT